MLSTDAAPSVRSVKNLVQWIKFLSCAAFMLIGPALALGEASLSHTTDVSHTVLAVSQSEKITFPRTITPPVPFTVMTRWAVPSGVDIADLYKDELTAKVTLWGPGFVKPMELVTSAPLPFPLPSLPLSGTYHLTDFRLYRGNQQIAHGLDETTLEVFENLLTTEVTTRPLTLAEIIDRGIVIDRSSFATMEFTAALAFVSQSVTLSAPPVVGPNFLFEEVASSTSQGAKTLPDPIVFDIPAAPDPHIPNLLIVPMDFHTVVDKDQTPPPPPPLSGLVVIPGQIGFLHQFFEAQLIVFQNAPQGAPLIVRDLQAKIILPTGADRTPGTDDAPGDDPLRIARQKDKETTRLLPILKVGGTQNRLSPQERGVANFLIEGLTEGTYDMQFEITGVLDGLPGGPVSVSATAHGSVLVRNPTFTLTLSHPKTVRSGEDYTLYAVVTNTGESAANLVSVHLNRNSVSGATLLSSEMQTVDTIDPQSSATLSFRLRSRVTGQVTATTFPTGDGLVGRFALRTGVGDLDIPLSPDTLVLPSYTAALPESVLTPAMGLLGLAYSISTAPAGALPHGISRMPKRIVEEKANAIVQAGLHVILGMSVQDALADLLPEITSGPAPYMELIEHSRQGKLLVDTIRALTKDASPSGSPHIIAATQPTPDQIGYPPTSYGCAMARLHQAGTYLFVLASEPLDKKTAEMVEHYTVDGEAPITAMLDSSGRFVILQLARPVGPFVERKLSVLAGLLTQSGSQVEAGDMPIVSHLSKQGAGVVSGRLLRAGGEVTDGAVTLTIGNLCPPPETTLGDPPRWPANFLIGKAGISGSKSAYQFDYVLAESVLIKGQDIPSGEYEELSPPIRYAGQTVALDLILRALGSMEVTLLDEQGNPASGAEVAVTSAKSFVTGQEVSLASALLITDEQGKVLFPDFPVGPYQVQARKGPFIAATSIIISHPRDKVLVTMQLVHRPEQASGSIVAGVVGPDGKTPVEGVWLRLSSLSVSAGYQKGGQTDAMGHITMTDFPEGNALLEMYDPASLETSKMEISVLPNQTSSVTIIEKGLGSVSGRVIDSQGKPVSGVLVVAVSDNTKWSFTDADGKFVFTAMGVGSVSLSATEPIRGRTARDVTTIRTPGDVAQVSLTLSSRASLIGTVIDQSGRPVDNAKVRIIAGDGGCPDPPEDASKSLIVSRDDIFNGKLDNFKAAVEALLAAQAACADAASENAISFIQTKTDSNGNYRFSNLDLTDRSFQSGTVIVVKGNDVANADFKLKRDGEVKRVDLVFIDQTATIKGQVLDRASNDLPVGARVVLYGVEPNAAGLLTEGRVIAWTDTDPQTGRFSFMGLAPGRFRLTASNVFHPDEVSVTGILEAGAVRKINLVFQKQLAGITGRVIGSDKKTPAVGVQVTTVLDSAPIEVITDADGIYKIAKVLPEGYYQVSVDDPATGAKSEPVTVMVAAGQEVNQPLQILGKGSIEVRVLTANGQMADQPVVKVTRVGLPLDQAEDKTTLGVIQFDALLEGKYAVEVFDPVLGRGARGEVVIPSDKKVGSVSVVLSETGLITGTFLAVDRTTPVSPARLSLFSGDKQVGVATTAEDGTFRFEHVPMGEMRVVGYNPATGRRTEGKGSLSIDGQEIPLVLVEEGLGTVAGKVLSADKTTPVPGATIRLTSLSPLGGIVGISSVDGFFTFEGIPVGAVSLIVEDRRNQQSASARGNIEQEGDHINFVMVQAGSGEIDGKVIFADGSPAPLIGIVSGDTYVQTDEEGQFALLSQPIGAVHIFAKEQNSPRLGEGFATITQQGEKLSVLIKLSGIGTLIVHALDGGTPMEGAKITVTPTNATFLTQANGEAKFERLAQGNYTVTALSQDQRRSVTMSARIVFDQQEVNTRMELGPVGSILASVKRGDGSSPAVGSVATLTGEKIVLTEWVDEKGALHFDQVPIGTYRLDLDEAGTGSGAVQGIARVVLTVQEKEAIDLGDIILDSEAIRVVALDPTDGASNVPLNQAIGVRFSEPPDLSSLSASAFQVIDLGTGDAIDGLFSFDPSQNFLTFSPKALLKSSTSYRIKIAGLTDRVGHPLFPMIDAAFQTADKIPPKMISMDPADGTIEVASASVMRIVFSEPIQTTGVVTLTTASHQPVPVQIYFAEENHVLIAKPIDYLQINQMYEVRVQGIADLSGNVMSKAVTARFSTKDTIPPTIDFFAFAPGTIRIAGKQARVMVNSSDLDLAKIEIALDGLVIGFAEGGTLAFTIPLLVSDQAVLTAVAIDKAGNRSIPSRLFVNAQDGPPIVSIASSTEPGPGESFSVTLKAADDGHLTAFTYSATGAMIQSENRTESVQQDEWTINLAIPETAEVGSLLTLSATAADHAGHTTMITRVFRLRDNRPPFVEIIAPEKLFFEQNAEIKIKASDANSNLASIAMEITGAVTTSYSFGLVGDKQDGEVIVPLYIPMTADGKSVTITAVAVDQFGNRGEAKSVSINLVGGVIIGTVFERTQPVANVTVWAKFGAERQIVATDKNGRFMMTGLSPGKVKIIAADAGRGLRAGGEVEIVDNGTIAHLDLILHAGGSLMGRLVTADGKPAGRYVTVQAQTGGISLQTLTDGTGSFQFDPLPMATVLLTATDLDGNQAEGSIRVIGADQPVKLQFISRGNVSGKVVFGDGKPVAYAQVTLYSARSETRTMIADADGKFSFDKIFAGTFTVTAIDPVIGISGTVSNVLPSTEGAKKEVTITLTQLGTVRGVIYSALEHKPVVGIQVTLSGLVYRATQTDQDGRFEFRDVPVYWYPYQLYAVGSDGDHAEATATLTKHGDVAVQDMTLAGFGDVVVTVTNSLGVPIIGADVIINGRAYMSAVTDDRGMASFPAVPSGQYNTGAKFHDNIYFAVYVSFTVAAGKQSPVALILKGGTIQGRILAADHITPVADVEVSFNGYWGRKTLTDAQGQFLFFSVDTGGYNLEARVNGHLRAVKLISLKSDGEEKTADMVLSAVGTVTGTVYDPSGAPLGYYGSVQLNFVDPLNGNTMTVYTKEDGSYQADQVPLGSVSAIASDYRVPNVKAEAEGTLSADGQVWVLNLHLSDNAVNLPTYLYTPGYQYYLSQDGTYTLTSHPSRRCDPCNQLTLTVNGQQALFPKSVLGQYEDDQREIGITREGVGGMVVTRKLFVPKRGYATRSLELLTNPTDEPITATIKLSSLSSSKHKPSPEAPAVQSDTGWIIVSGKEKEDFLTMGGEGNTYQRNQVGDEAYAVVFGGSAKRGQLFLQHTKPRNAENIWWEGKERWETDITYGMEEVVIAPGETVGFLHFDSVVWDKEGEQATVDRLKGLPPEMLEGVSDSEKASIINFDLTKDRNIELTATKMLSKLTVHVFQKVNDQIIPMPNTRIDFKSTDPIFPITRNGMTDANGSLIVDYQNTPGTIPPPLPTGPIDIRAFAQLGQFDPITDKIAALSSRKIVLDSEGELSADLVFTETGTAVISFERPGGIAEWAYLNLQNTDTGKNYTIQPLYSPASSATSLGLPPGQYHAELTLIHPQRWYDGPSALLGLADFSITASDRVNVVVPIEPTGHVEGEVKTLSGQQVSGLTLQIMYAPKDVYSASRAYVTYTDQLGRYQFIHLPVGPAKLIAVAPDTGLRSTIGVDIVQGATIQHDIVLAPPSVMLRVKAVLPNGQIAANAAVELYLGSKDWYGNVSTAGMKSGVTDQDGIVQFEILTTQWYTLRVYRPEAQWSHFFTDQAFQFRGEGEITGTVDAVVTLSFVADLKVTVTHCGTPVPGSLISIKKAGSSSGPSQYTNGEGWVVFNILTDESYTLQVVSLGGALVPVRMTPSDDGHIKSVVIPFCEVPLSGQVVAADGETGIPNASVSFKDAKGHLLDQIKTDAGGHFNTSYKFQNGMDVTIQAISMAVSMVQTVTINSEKNETITLPLFILPFSVVKGGIHRMYHGSLEPVTDATLFLVSSGVDNQSGRVVGDSPYFYKDGRYIFLGLPVGDFEITANTPNNGQTKTVKVSIQAIEQAVDIDLLFPPVNDLRVLMKDADGNPLKEGWVGVDQIGTPFTIHKDFKSEEGVLVLERLLVGVGLVVAVQNNNDYYAISPPQFVVLPETSELVTTTLSLPKMVSVAVQAVQADGLTPLAEGGLHWEGAVPTPFGSIVDRFNYSTLGNGEYVLRLPAGPVRLEVTDWLGLKYGYRLADVVGGEHLTVVADKETEDSDSFGRLPESNTFYRLFRPSIYLISTDSLNASLLLTIGQRLVSNGTETYWIEGEAVRFPPQSIGSLLLARRFINMPESGGVLSIDEITNPYPASIEVAMGMHLMDYQFQYSQFNNGILWRDSSNDWDSFDYAGYPDYLVFGSSVQNHGQRIVIPANSCRSVVHLWSRTFHQDQDEPLSDGINLLSRFLALDFKSIIAGGTPPAGGKSCPLAE